MPAVVYEKRDQIAYISLNRPEVLNAFNDELDDALAAAFKDFRDDPDMLAAILTGEGGKAFTTGADLREMAAKGLAAGRRDLNSYPVKLDVWKPVIAAIDGYALAGGMELALQCDIRIASAQSKLGFPAIRMGGLAGYSLTRLSSMIPMGEALYLLLSGSYITADEALRAGLVHKVLPDRESLLREAMVIAEDIKLCAPLAVQAMKRIVYMTHHLPPKEAEALVEPIRERIARTEDAMEGPMAFAERRRPVWRLR